MRVRITLAYNGTTFMGSQEQTSTGNTVMGTLHRALARLGIDARPVASGRTDSGVHATGQVVHCDLPPHWGDIGKLRSVLNRQLPPAIRIRRIEPVHPEFHARFSARRRVYRYVLSEAEPNPFEHDFVTFSPPLDVAKIDDAIQAFVGTHDFEKFKKTGSETAHDRRTIFKASAYRWRGKVILRIEGNGFLRSQIRMMVGFLLDISAGKRTKEELIRQLECEADYKIKPAPHNGLYLAKIYY
jgi:tRNA pseudouridine38-40 synthase